MTTLYRPVLIESAEQAEALPVGTVIHRNIGDRTETGSRANIPDGSTFDGGLARWTSEAAIGWTALVPIAAEEELQRTYATPASTFPGLSWPEQHDAWKRRLVTPWESV